MKKKVEVICRHTEANRVIPLKIVIMDRKQEKQIFIVKQSKIVKPYGKMTIDNVKFPAYFLCIECSVLVSSGVRIVGLAYNSQTLGWTLYY